MKMPRIRRSRIACLLAGGMAAGLMLGASQAEAAQVCSNGGGPGAGERVVGQTQGGNGVASVALCEQVLVEDYGDEESGGKEQVRPDPVQAGIGSMMEIQRTELAILGRIEELKKDPRYAPIIAGKWDFYQDRPSGRPGEYCAALFTNAAGMLRVSGPGGDYPGAMITFWGPDIPKPDKLRIIKVALTQSDDNKPQTVRAYNYTQGNLDYGAVAFTIPSASALVDNMIDRLSFTLEVDGKRVLFMGWHSGLKARDKLRQCMGKRS